jgi:hypothetical protein
MATWIAHLRIADKLMKQMNIQNINEFIVGNIGPDCGVPNEDWSEFDPPGEISHWRLNKNKEIDYNAFYTKYCIIRNSDFYLGYYIHLITDYLWGKIINQDKMKKYKNDYYRDKNFIWTMKKDWYDLDKKYLNENVLFTYNEFIKIKEFENTYFDFYPENAFIRQIKYITDFYESRDRNLNREFIFLTEDEMDDFVEIGFKRILKNLSEIGEVVRNEIPCTPK